ncbi:MAG: serine--tRNA ligase [Bacteriovoracaceae bacterium]|nr:serine--tRNA ligase [Bacteriovoracaceae bacterium]
MLDIKKIETDFETVKNSLAKRNFDTSILDQIVNLNKSRKALTLASETKKAEINKISREIGELKKNKQDAAEPMAKVAALKAYMEKEAKELDEVQTKQTELLLNIPNLPVDSVPVGKDEEENVEVGRWGTPREMDFTPVDHAELGERLGILDFDIATKITGARFVVYKGAAARLERALINFMLDHQGSKGFTEMMTPFIAHERSLLGTGNLPKFEDQLFKLNSEQPWYLIPTSEVTLTNLKREQIVDEAEMPFLYAAYSPCFRSEAGSHGKDVKGLIRMHQFNKVEMVAICSPAQSEEIHQKMVASATEILQKLGLPYRVLALCTGDMGFASQKTFDLEVWVPSQNKYREISSISNCGDFQARRANIRFRNKEGKVEFAHTLNGSGLAVGRTVVAILENYQQKDGSVKIPEVLVPYMGGMKEIRK